MLQVSVMFLALLYIHEPASKVMLGPGRMLDVYRCQWPHLVALGWSIKPFYSTAVDLPEHIKSHSEQPTVNLLNQYG